MIGGREHFVCCDAHGTAPVELFSIEKQKRRLILASDFDLQDNLKSALLDVPNFLPIAAECYNISPDINDYICQPVISMPSDIPNRNQQAFPFSQLSAWTPDAGCVMYKTWVGKPLFIEHNNKDHTKAKGIILSCMMRPIQNTAGDIWKVIKLAAWDRRTYPIEANEILTRKRNAWSMGAYARSYTCSICAKDISKDCGHLQKDKPSFKLFGNRLAYWNVVDPYGFELSTVKSPAYASARGDYYFTMDDLK